MQQFETDTDHQKMNLFPMLLVFCLGQGADLHMAQLMQLPLLSRSS